MIVLKTSNLGHNKQRKKEVGGVKKILLFLHTSNQVVANPCYKTSNSGNGKQEIILWQTSNPFCDSSTSSHVGTKMKSML